MVSVKTIFYKSLDLPASSGFKKIQQVSNPMLEMNYLNPVDNRWEKWNLNVDDTNLELAGAPGRTRTSNLLIRRP